MHDLRGGADELELTLRRADPPEQPDDLPRRQRARRDSDLLRHEPGVGDRDVNAWERLGGRPGVGDDLVGAPVRHAPHQPDEGSRQVVGGDAVVHVPDERATGQTGRRHAEDVRLERGGVDDVDVEVPQASRQTHDKGSRGHSRAKGGGQASDLVAGRGPERRVQWKHLDGVAALAEQVYQRSGGEEDDVRLNVVALGESVHEAQHGQLGATGLRGVIKYRHPDQHVAPTHGAKFYVGGS